MASEIVFSAYINGLRRWFLARRIRKGIKKAYERAIKSGFGCADFNLQNLRQIEIIRSGELLTKEKSYEKAASFLLKNICLARSNLIFWCPTKSGNGLIIIKDK